METDYLHDVRTSDTWMQQRTLFFEQQGQHDSDIPGHAVNRDEDFVFHLLDVHAKFCIKPSCNTAITTSGDDSISKSHSNSKGLQISASLTMAVPLNSCTSDLSKTSQQAPVASDGWILEQPCVDQGSPDQSHDESHDDEFNSCTSEDDHELEERKDCLDALKKQIKTAQILLKKVEVPSEPQSRCKISRDRNPKTRKQNEEEESCPDEQTELDSPEVSSAKSDSAQDPDWLEACNSDGDSCGSSQGDDDIRKKKPRPSQRRTSKPIDDRSFKCKYCPKDFSREFNLRRHLRDIHTHETKKPFKCNVCLKTFSQHGQFVIHERVHTGEKPFMCHICGKSFAINARLKKHMKLHTIRNRPYKCTLCESAFNENKHLIDHMRTHTGERPFKCTTCPKAFFSSSAQSKHAKTHSTERPFKCTTCSKAFIDKRSLQRHDRTHTGTQIAKPFKCKVCANLFTSSTYLKVHMRIHTGEKPFICHICAHPCRKMSDLKSHMKTHTGERPFSCSVCQKSFAHKHYLLKHEKLHTGEKPFECTVCHKTFALTGSLRTHMVRVHSGKKPHKCQVCSKAFSTRSHVKQHMRTHPGVVISGSNKSEPLATSNVVPATIESNYTEPLYIEQRGPWDL